MYIRVVVCICCTKLVNAASRTTPGLSVAGGGLMAAIRKPEIWSCFVGLSCKGLTEQISYTEASVVPCIFYECI